MQGGPGDWGCSHSVPPFSRDHGEMKMNTTSPAPSIYTPAMGHRIGPSLSLSAKQVDRILTWGEKYQSFKEAKDSYECIPTTFLKQIPMHTKFHQLLSGGGGPLRTLPWSPP